MSYRLKVKEPLAEGLRRVALDQIEIVDGELRGNADAETAIHNARRALKRLRALLRLVRPGLDPFVYRRETQRLAETGRLLAGERDRHVMRQTLKKLTASATPPLPDALLTSFETLLSASAAVSLLDPAQARQKAIARMATSRRFFESNAIAGLAIEHAFEGVGKVYRKGRRLHRTCLEPATDEDFHALRKCVQQHWRHMQLLSRAWPDALSARAAEAKMLSQLLGEDHDFAVLISYASAHVDALPEEGVSQLVALARKEQAHLRAQVHLHGGRLFAEPARDLVARLQSYWAAAQGLAEQAARAEVAADVVVQPPVTNVRARRTLRQPLPAARKPRARTKASQA